MAPQKRNKPPLLNLDNQFRFKYDESLNTPNVINMILECEQEYSKPLSYSVDEVIYLDQQLPDFELQSAQQVPSENNDHEYSAPSNSFDNECQSVHFKPTYQFQTIQHASDDSKPPNLTDANNANNHILNIESVNHQNSSSGMTTTDTSIDHQNSYSESVLTEASSECQSASPAPSSSYTVEPCKGQTRSYKTGTHKRRTPDAKKLTLYERNMELHKEEKRQLELKKKLQEKIKELTKRRDELREILQGIVLSSPAYNGQMVERLHRLKLWDETPKFNQTPI